MKNKIYRETLEYAWGKETFVLKGRKGTRIYKEIRKNHLPGMYMVTEDGEFPLENHDYLVFEIKGLLHPETLLRIAYHHGVYVDKKGDKTEIACHHPQVFHSPILSNLVKQGYIQRSWKDYSTEERIYPLYVNPNGLEIIYNAGSLITQYIHNRLHRLWKNMSKGKGNENGNQ